MTLTTQEQAQFQILRKRIRIWWEDRVAVGEALAEIRDLKLYVDEFETFENFCKAEFGVSRSQAYRLIDCKKVDKSLEIKEGVSPKLRLRHARELIPIPPERRTEVLANCEALGKITAKTLAKARRDMASDWEVVRDDTGYAVPAKALPYWNRKAEVKELLAHISAARSAIRKVVQDDPMFVETNLNAVLADLNSAYTGLEVSVPYAVCPSCQGQIPKQCTLCKGRGVVSKFRFKMAPEELIAIREKSCVKK